MSSGERIYILADMHLKPLDALTRRARDLAVAENERLAAFLSMIEGKAAAIILLGDAFNFWFERRGRMVGDFDAALSMFKLAADGGIAVHHVCGNRDYAVGEGLGVDPATRYPGFLRLKSGFTVSCLADYGIDLHGPRYRFHQAGKTVTCLHGDSLCTGKRIFMLFRWLTQGPIGRWVMRWSPWSLLELAVSVEQSNTRQRTTPEDPAQLLGEAAVKREIAMGTDLLLCGHIHTGYERDVSVAGRRGRMVVVPAWLNGYYGVLENGEIRVEKFGKE